MIQLPIKEIINFEDYLKSIGYSQEKTTKDYKEILRLRNPKTKRLVIVYDLPQKEVIQIQKFDKNLVAGFQESSFYQRKPPKWIEVPEHLVKECIQLLKTDGINSKATVIGELEKVLAGTY